MRRLTVVSLLVVTGLMVARPAWAPYHLSVIDQLFFGTENAPDAQYAQLRTLASGQIFVNGQNFPTFNADGSDAANFGTFTQNFGAHPSAGVTILAGTQEAKDLFCVALDQIVTGRLVSPDGRVCFGLFDGPVDCVAYGNYTGDNTPRGQPAAAPQAGLALMRVSNTSDNQADFELHAPTPRNNPGMSGSIDGVPGDPDGTGTVDIANLGHEVAVLFEAGKRCDLSDPTRRGADANVDTRVNAADVTATIQIALPESA